MSDDTTQPFGGNPSLSPRYGKKPMIVDELARRVWQAEHRMMAAGVRDIETAEVVLNPEDYLDIVTAFREPQDESWGQMVWNDDTGRHQFRGHPLRMDNDLKQGEVRLRTEVPA
jgi:hypothetical protein